MSAASVAWFALAVFSFIPVASAATRNWQKLTGPRFTIVSQLRESETRDWAEEFDQFVTELTGFLGIQDVALQPVTVVLFRTRSDFAPYRPARPDGEPAELAGVFVSRDTWSVIGLSRGGDEDWIRRVILHEGVHWIASNDRRFYPLWVSEGLAEVFSTFRVGHGNAQWGDPIPSHLQQLQTSTMMPLGQLLRVGQSDPLFNESDRTGIFYAQSWALVHYLIFGARKDSSGSLSAYLQAVRSGRSIEETIQTVFGADETTFQRQLAAYLARGKAFRLSRPIPEDAGSEFTVVDATPGEVAAAQARLAFGTGNVDLAQEQASHAVSLAPNLTAAHEVLAWVASAQSNEAKMGVHAERAIKLGSRDAWMYLFFGSALRSSKEAQTASAGELARALANLLEQAINLDPTLREAYESLAAQMANAEPLRPSDREFLTAGRKRFPDSGHIIMGLAFIAERGDDRREVARLLQETDSAAVDLSSWSRESRDLMRRRSVLQDLEPRVRALISDKNIPEALILYDEAIGNATDAFLERQLKMDRLRLAFSAAVEIARTARYAGQLAEARRQCEEILRWPDLSRSQRSVVTTELQLINRESLAQPGGATIP